MKNFKTLAFRFALLGALCAGPSLGCSGAPAGNGSDPDQRAQELIELLKSSDPDVRREAALEMGQVAGNVGEKTIPAIVDALIEALGDSQEHVRSYSSSTLARLGPEAKRAIPALIKSVKISRGPALPMGIMALGSMGPDAKAAVPAILPHARNPNDFVRGHAIKALVNIEPENPSCVAAAGFALLSDPSVDARRDMVRMLVGLKEKARIALPALSAAYMNPKEALEIRFQAAGALAFLEPSRVGEVQAFLFDQIGSGNLDSRDAEAAFEAVAQVSEGNEDASREAAALAMGILVDPKADALARLYAGEALGKLAPRGGLKEDEAQALLAIVSDSSADWRVRNGAGEALALLTPEGDADLKELFLKLLQDPAEEPAFRSAMARLAVGVARDDERLPPILIDMVENEPEEYPWGTDAIRALEALGPRAEPAIPALERFIAKSPPSSFPATVARRSLEKIRAAARGETSEAAAP